MKSLNLFLCASLVFLFFPGCAPLIKPSKKRPLEDRQVDKVVCQIVEQEELVTSFYALGSISIKDWLWEREANILIAGTKSPLRIKIEITHPWGQPILHILFEKKRFRVISFPDRTLYFGELNPKTLSRFLPVDFDMDLLWATLRAFPILLGDDGKSSLKANQISLFSKEGVEVQVIDLYPEDFLPKSVFFPQRELRMKFADFLEHEGIYYAREVEVNYLKGKNLKFKHSKVVFNRSIPEEIFALDKPTAFEIVHIKNG
jgi:hypothetical protein